MAAPGARAAKLAVICGEQWGLSVSGFVMFADAKSTGATADLSVRNLWSSVRCGHGFGFHKGRNCRASGKGPGGP